MTTLPIRGLELALARPDDLADRVLADSGLSIEEARRVLLVTSPAMLARAILPLLPADSGVNRTALAWALIGEDLGAIVTTIAPFYAPEEPNAGE